MKIKNIHAIEVLSSRGYPTIKTKVTLESGEIGEAMVPQGASKGKREAYEMIDKNPSRYKGLGVEKAVKIINNDLAKFLIGQEIDSISDLDKKLIDFDSTPNKEKYGANSILSISIAFTKALARSQNKQIFEVLKQDDKSKIILPVPMLNIINGGMHAKNNLDFQEFMILPIGARSFKEAIRMAVEVYITLKGELIEKGLNTGVGDEGGFAPNLEDDEAALKLISDSIKKSGYKLGKDFVLSLDIAASSWRDEKTGKYIFPKSHKEFTLDELLSYYDDLSFKYPLFSIEDGLDEEDYDGWSKMNIRFKDRLLLVGDDLYVTNKRLLKKGIDENLSNAILIKPNQIGSVTETLETIQMAKNHDMEFIVSHRSSDTCDSFIADLAVSSSAHLIKSGAPCRSERVEKYNRLLEIEDSYPSSIYAGEKILKLFKTFSSSRYEGTPGQHS